MSRTTVVRRRLTREEKKRQTRRELLDVAARVFVQRGFFATSVDEVAEEAGYSRGAVYSNFADKEDLFLALMDEYVERRIQRCTDLARTEAIGGARTAEHMYAVIFDDEEPEWISLFLEFWACAARNPQLQERFAPRYRAMKAAVARLIAENARLSVPPEQVATALFAISLGVALERVADAGAVREQLFEQMIEAYLAAVASPGR